VSAYFLVMGLTAGVWMARVPAAKAQVHLSDGTLGVALFALPVGLVLGAALAERLVDRLGSHLDQAARPGAGHGPGPDGTLPADQLPDLLATLYGLDAVLRLHLAHNERREVGGGALPESPVAHRRQFGAVEVAQVVLKHDLRPGREDVVLGAGCAPSLVDRPGRIDPGFDPESRPFSGQVYLDDALGR